MKTSYAASSTLAKQIEQDAPANVFISADLDWMDYLGRQRADKAREPFKSSRQQACAGCAEGQRESPSI